jgi:Phosphotransferase enzyme family
VADRVPVDVSIGNLAEHPAAVAWNRLTGAGALPSRITQLNQGHSLVYRLAGMKENPDSLIAKLCARQDAEMTRIICTRLLPLVPKPALAFYGCLEMQAGKAWLFLEDAGHVKCSLEDTGHRRAMSAWLSALHACLADHVEGLSLPETGLSMYLQQLRAGRRKILKSLSLLELQPEDYATLQAVVEWFDHVEDHWDKLQALAADGPRTLAHGDFAPKNVLVRQAAGTLEVFPIDWETAGWGPPAADMGECADLVTYREEALKYGVSWSAGTIRGWAAVGKILRHIAAFEWASASLIGGWPPRGVRRMKVRLEDAWIASTLEF